jgi:homocysteine S-methyltransferase
VAASVGSYGAFLADGSEYKGQYKLNTEELMDWHRPRVRALVAAKPDLLACETVPCLNEVRALVRLLRELQLSEQSKVQAWISVSCSDGQHLCSGELLSELVPLIEAEDSSSAPQLQQQEQQQQQQQQQQRAVCAVGVNCTAPQHIAECIRVLSNSSADSSDIHAPLQNTDRRLIVVYPNAGMGWDAVTKQWIESESQEQQFAQLAVEWRAASADCIGGCCKVSPETISAVRAALKQQRSST